MKLTLFFWDCFLLYRRAFNRRDGIIWMNNTPASVEPNPEGVNYRNLRGEQAVNLFVNTRANDCSIKIGSNRPETDRLTDFQPPSQVNPSLAMHWQ